MYLQVIPPYKLRKKFGIKGINTIRKENPDYGYRRVTQGLHNQAFNTNHKVVLKIMKMNGILCTAFNRVTRKYNSYVGTVDHRVNRRFITDRPYQKVLTDVTEMRWGSTVSERAYFTAYIDVYSGEIFI